MGKQAAVALVLIVGLCLTGCSRLARESPRSYTTVVANPSRDLDGARAACDRAAKHFAKGDLVRAEAALHDALIADVSYAPAHNNLGRVYFDQGNLYLAAWEFEYARRLLPESAEVVNNLGLVYESAGQNGRAIESYSQALSLDPGNSEYMGNLARILVRDGKDPTQAAVLLRDLILRDSRAEWVTWARDQVHLSEPVRAAFSRLESESACPAHPAEVIPTPRRLHDQDLPPWPGDQP